MSPTLPTEVLELVFACLNDDNDVSALRACSLVSSYFLPVARRFLFQHVFLLPEARQPMPRSCSLASRGPVRSQEYTTAGTRSESLSPYLPVPRTSVAQSLPEPEPHSGNACVKLLRLLSMSPFIAHYIKRISVIDGRLFPSTEQAPFQNDTLFAHLVLDNTQSHHYFEIRDKLNGPRWFLSTPPRILYSLFQQLNICAFDLVFPDGPRIPWDFIPRGIRSALSYVFVSPSFNSLELRNVSWDTPTSLRDFTSTLAQGPIKNLTLCNVKLLSTAPGPERERASRHQHDQVERSRPNQHLQSRARGRSPTPRNDPAAFHAPQAQAHQYGAHLDPSPIPFAKPNLSPFTGQNQNQTSHIRHTLLPSTSSPPYTFSDLHHRNHYYHSDGGDVLGVKSDVTLRLKSLAIVGSASSDPSAPQDPDSSQTALDLLKVLLLSPPSCSHTSNSSNIVTGSGTRNDRQSSAVPFNPGSRAPAASSLVHVYTNGIPRSNTDNHHQHVFNDECEDEGPLVDPYSLKKLALPNVEFGKIPEMIDILSRCGPGGNGIEELTLSDRLSHSGATFPMNSNTSSRNNASEVDFSALQSLRALRLGAYISPTFVQLQPQIHLSRAALLASTLPSPHDFSTVTAQVSTRQLTWLVEALRTIPPELDSLSLGLSIDKSLIRLHGQGHSTTVQFIDDEIREIVDYLRTIQNRRPRLRIDVTSKFTSSLPTSFGSTFLGSGFSTGAGAGECYSEDRGRGEVRGRSWDYASRSRGDERISGGQGDLSRGAGEDGLRRWVGDVFSGVTDLG